MFFHPAKLENPTKFINYSKPKEIPIRKGDVLNVTCVISTLENPTDWSHRSLGLQTVELQEADQASAASAAWAYRLQQFTKAIFGKEKRFFYMKKYEILYDFVFFSVFILLKLLHFHCCVLHSFHILFHRFFELVLTTLGSRTAAHWEASHRLGDLRSESLICAFHGKNLSS